MARSGANCLNTKNTFSSKPCNYLKTSFFNDSKDEMDSDEHSPSLLNTYHSLPNPFFNKTLNVSSKNDDQLTSKPMARPALDFVKIYPDIFSADSEDDLSFESAKSNSSNKNSGDDKPNKFEQARTDISEHCASLILSNDSDNESGGKPAANCSDSSLKENNSIDVNENCKSDKYSKFLVPPLKCKKSNDVKNTSDRSNSNLKKISLHNKNSNNYPQPSTASRLDSDEETPVNIAPNSSASTSQSQLAAVRKANNTLSNLRLIHPDIFSADSESDEESFKPLPISRKSVANRSKPTCPPWRRKRADVASTSGRSAFYKNKKSHIKAKNKSQQSLAQIFPETFSIYSDSEDEQPGRQTPKRRRDNDLSIAAEKPRKKTPSPVRHVECSAEVRGYNSTGAKPEPSLVAHQNKRPRPSISTLNNTTSFSGEPAYSNVFSFSMKLSDNFDMGAHGEPDILNEYDLERCRGSSTSRSSDSSSTVSSNSPASFDDLIILSDDTSHSSSESSQDNFHHSWAQTWHRRRHFHRATRQARRGVHRQGGNSPNNPDGFVDDPVEVVNQVQDDEDYARQLQAAFDAEDAGLSSFSMTRLPSPPRYYELPPWSVDSTVEGDQLRGRPSRRSRRINCNSNPGGESGAPWIWAGLRDLLHFPWLRQNHQSSGRRRSSRRGRHRSGTYDSNDYDELLRLAEHLGEETPKKTLSRGQIERLPTRQYVVGSACSGEDNVCSVCMSPYEGGQQLRILPCFHEFHKTCIDPWIKNNPTCPICRVEVELN